MIIQNIELIYNLSRQLQPNLVIPMAVSGGDGRPKIVQFIDKQKLLDRLNFCIKKV